MKLTKSELILIENVVNNSKKFTRSAFAERLEIEGFPFSNSTITRILQNIYDEIGLQVKFKRNDICIIIEEESDPNYLQKYHSYKSLFFRYILQKSTIENAIQNQFISFSFDTENRNIELLEPILNSIIDSKIIKIGYKKFHKNLTKEYFVNPLFVKEYLNRWYIIGDTETIENKVFALDRIDNIEFLNQKFKNVNSSNFEIYKDTIGVNFSNKAQKVVLWVSEKQFPYFQSLPLHKSQKIIEKTEDGVIISIEVSMNYELERWILYYGKEIKVIEPLELKDKIRIQLSENLRNYEN